MNGCTIIALVSFLIIPLLLSSCAGPQRMDSVPEVEGVVRIADPVMGDWQGDWELDNGGDSGSLAAQVIALGKGQYRAMLFNEFDSRREPLAVLDGRLDGAAVNFAGRTILSDSGTELEIQAAIKGGQFNGSFKGDEFGSFSMSKVVRLSPTLRAEPPAGAIVLFDGKNFSQWEQTEKKPSAKSVQWKLVGDGAMEVIRDTGSIVTKKKFTDFKLHLEFRTPFMPEKRGQARGNSGVYLQGRYEVQVLDSYGLEGLDNDCGGIYKVGRPLVNMCAPPLQWQTYDITFHAPRPDGTGTESKSARATVVHNGLTIHDDLELPKPTGGALDSNITEPGGIYLQDHGNPVQFRNIWLVEL
jgi:hypothetical protein